EIVDIVGRFARAAAVAKRAGVSGVQIHAAHGYLVSQFLSPLTNRRDDAWGGDAARRRRFLLEIVAAVRAEVGPAWPIGVKLNSADFQRGGFSEGKSMDVVVVLEATRVAPLP
ncbi:MAG: NADH:flavin oxidoreductase, partial [Myxococcota bacterium]